MTEYTPIDGSPAETVGTSRLVAAEESDDGQSLRLSSVPRTWIDILRRRMTGIHILVVMIALFGLEAILAKLADALLYGLDLSWLFSGLAVATILLLSVAFFGVVNGDEDVDPDDKTPTVLTLDPDTYRVERDGVIGRRTLLEGETWDFAEELGRLNRSRIGFSTEWVAALRPTGSLRSYLVAGMTERDRDWLERQLEIG